ncbi:PepSY-associated TM helix domain-containing protein [Dyella koreensis]|uniref:PepSY domain-containing protein n=1 Tax=Dyella koreensis TaxID=311235 RepID=A0ABW8K4E7_9GAMM
MTPASHPPVRHRWRLRDVLRKLHLWLGLSIGLLFAVLALSGTVLAYQTELLKWRHPELTQHALPTAEQQAAVLQHIHETRWPLPLRSVDLPDADLPVWQLFLDGQTRVYLDPIDGRQLLLRSPDNDCVLWLRYLHTHLLGGKTGELWLGVIGIVELSLLLIGLVLWWPRKGHWRHAVHMYAQPPIRRWRSWHQSVGAIAFPLLLLSTLTGVTLIYKDTTRAALSSLFGGKQAPSKLPTLTPRDAPVQWLPALVAAQAALPQAELNRITLPSAKNAALIIRARGPEEWNVVGRSVVVVDPYTASVMAVQDAQQQGRGNRWSDNIYPLHAGAVGGSTWQFVIAIVGVLPAFFAVTGFLFWWTRTRHRKHAQRASG